MGSGGVGAVPALKTQIVLFTIHQLHFGLWEGGYIAAGVENLIEVLRETCVWLACQGPAQSMF